MNTTAITFSRWSCGLLLLASLLPVGCGNEDGDVLTSAPESSAGGGESSAGAAGKSASGAGTSGSGQATGGAGTAGAGASGGGKQGGSGNAGSGNAGSGNAGSGNAGSGQAGQGAGGASAGNSGTAGSGAAAGAGPNTSDAEQYCVDKINEYRKTLDLPPYARWTDGESCADGEAKSDSETMKAHGAFGTCGEFAQDECPGWPGPEMNLLDGCLAQMWAEGPGEPYSAHGHYINMSSTKYTQASCGFYQTPDGSFWAVQNFK